MIVTIDFETYYTQQYSLQRMTEVDYLLDPRFEVICCGIKRGDEPTEIRYGSDVAAALDTIPWEEVAVLSHNMRFDGAILAWHFGHLPKLYLDTLAMARSMTHAYAGGSSLKKVCAYLGLPPKGDEVVRAIGKTLADFTPEELTAYGDYCIGDTDLCKAVFDRFRPAFPVRELALIDVITRMFILPQARLDSDVLAAHLAEVRAAKAAAMARVAYIDPIVFSSQHKFAQLLESLHVTVPYKLSPASNEMIPALARNDVAFRELCDDDTQPAIVQAVLAARLNAKSTLEETRSEALLKLSMREWGDGQRGHMPVPLKYYGAHTGRLSGDGGFNFQNFKRGSLIRRAIKAPPRHRVVHRDSSQIEARIVAWLANCKTLLTAFLTGRDIYSEFATSIYHRRIRRTDVGERFCGKTAILSLGFGCGAPRFRRALFIGSEGVNVDLSEEQADAIVALYRKTFCEIPALWNLLGLALHRMRDPSTMRTIHLDSVEFDHHCLWLPNGMAIQYPRLRTEKVTDRYGTRTEWFYDSGKGSRKLYGGKLLENIAQALARIILTDIAVRVHRETGLHPCMTTHDSLDYVVPEHQVEAWDRYLEGQFAMVPAWAECLPLASEGGWGHTLEDAEKALNQ